jgi:DNA-directed DNA polymerase III PolC
VDLYRAAKKTDVRPIIGAEILTAKQRAILLAENAKGYANLCRIITARNLNPDFDLIEQLTIDSRGVIGICTQRELLGPLKEVFSRDNLFVGCRNTRETQWARAHGIEPVAWTNANWLDPDDIEVAQLLARIRQLSGPGAGPEDHCGFNALVPEKQVKRRFRPSTTALAHADQLVERCEFELLRDRPILPRATLPKGTTGDWELARLCHRGLAQRYNPLSKDVVKRLEYELTTIQNNGFSDYFLVVHEIVNFAKRMKIPVEVRGSAAGSLVAHVLGFTRVCPVENQLYFERFMNPGRSDCPDIDIDFCWRGRDEVIRFCYDHWGVEQVAMVCNINRYRRRSAIRDVARALGWEPAHINQLTREGKIKSTSPVYRLAEKLIGVPRHLGVHCGGILVTPTPVCELAPLQRANKGVIIAQYDKDTAEAVGLVKIDLLGNRSLSTVDETIRLVNRRPHTNSEFNFDPDDEKTTRMLSEGDSFGVFQSESPGMRQLLRGLRVRSRKDLAIALSLIRPGPAAGGMKAEFIERHVNAKPFEYLHPKIERLLGDTYGVMLYQEDVMRIAVEVAGYSVADADRFRSEVSKRVSAARVQAQYDDFVRRRAEKAGIDRESAEAIWDEVLRFAAYSYCKAHATVYANIAWQTAYLKAHHPAAFYCALFNNHHGMYPLRVYVWDAKRHGITILPPHVNHGDIEWTLEGRAIRAGLDTIKGLCRKTARAIIACQRAERFSSVDDLRRRVSFRRPELQNLIHVGACDGLGPTRPVMLRRLRQVPADQNQPLLFDFHRERDPARWPDYDRIAKLKAELDVTGIPFSLHPGVLLPARYVAARKLCELLGKTVTVAGFVATARRARTNDGRVMGFVTLDDATGLTEVSFFPNKLDLYRTICSYGGPVWVSGRVTEHLSSVALECTACGKVA